MTQKIKAAILGASGYTGAELIRLLLAHPYVEIAALTADSQAGKAVDAVYPHLRNLGLPNMVSIDQVDFADIDLVFCCLPHGTTQEIIAGLPKHMRIIDLSADFRLKDVNSYNEWYGHPHKALELQKEAVYGLTEHARQAVKTARLVANPGCYPTSALLPLIPLLQHKQIFADSIIIDAKSGISGAGRTLKQANLFTEVDGGMSAYGVGLHRHMPEIGQGLSAAAGTKIHVRFTPHLIPMSRGMLSTIYVTLAENVNVDDIRATLEATYKNEPFVHLLPPGIMPSTHQVRGTNHCVIGVFEDRLKHHAIIVCVIDNLVKGASGQAVQNMNVMYGWEEILCLTQTALFP